VREFLDGLRRDFGGLRLHEKFLFMVVIPGFVLLVGCMTFSIASSEVRAWRRDSRPAADASWIESDREPQRGSVALTVNDQRCTAPVPVITIPAGIRGTVPLRFEQENGQPPIYVNVRVPSGLRVEIGTNAGYVNVEGPRGYAYLKLQDP
jgi:hypothetical protein